MVSRLSFGFNSEVMLSPNEVTNGITGSAAPGVKGAQWEAYKTFLWALADKKGRILRLGYARCYDDSEHDSFSPSLVSLSFSVLSPLLYSLPIPYPFISCGKQGDMEFDAGLLFTVGGKISLKARQDQAGSKRISQRCALKLHPSCKDAMSQLHG